MAAMVIYLVEGIVMKVIVFILSLVASVSVMGNEIEAAREGAPAHVSTKASVMVWGDGKFVTKVKGTNSFTCLVLRDDKGRFEPSCLNAQAVKSVLPVYEYLTQKLEECVDIKVIYKEIEAKAKLGEFPKPEAGALVYMMSKRNKFYDHFGGKLMDLSPHIMMYSSRVEADSLGFTGEDGLPMFYQEFPHLSVVHIDMD